MNKKYLKAIGLAATCALAPAIISSGATFAASNDYISLRQHESGKSDEVCYFYRSAGYSEYYKQCDLSYGSYDEATNVLILKTAINNLPNTSVDFGNDTQATVTSDGDIETAFSASRGIITFDFGSYTYKEKPYQSETSLYGNSFGALTIKSGTFTLQQINADDLKVLGGDTTVTYSGVGSAINLKNFVMSGGSIVSPTSDIFMWIKGDVVINGGEILAENTQTGIYFQDDSGTFAMTGGKVNLKAASSEAGFGIVNHNANKNTTISGGELTIDGFDWGISGQTNKLIFNGGVTTIKNSKKHTIWLTYANDPEHDIVFGDNMGIKENTYVFWDDDEYNPSTGIAESGNVTIASGYTYRRHYGWESMGDDTHDDSGDSNIPTVPDTGIFGMDGKTATIVGAIAALPVLATLSYGINFVVKRNKQRVKF